MGEGFNKENIVQDIKDQEGLKENLKKNVAELDSDIDVSNFNFEEFDKAIEKSFQDFLKTFKFNDGIEKEDIQESFNEWLDKQYNNLDTMKNNEIDNAIVGPIKFELIKDATKVELEELQRELLEAEKKKIENDLTGLKTYSVQISDIAVWCCESFDKRAHMLNLLKEKKTDSIKKFQRIIAGIDETDNSKDDAPETKEILGGKGVDGMFGKGTLKAFQEYVEKYSKLELNRLTPKKTKDKDIEIKENKSERKEIAEKNGDSTETAPVAAPVDTPVDTPEGDNDATVNGTNRSTSSGRDVSVQYETSQTMSKENYTRKVENAKREKEAIRRLLGLKGLSNQTKDMSYGIEGYTIKPLSDEWYNLVNLKDCLIDFQDAKDQDYNLVYCFQTIFEQYQSGKDVAKIELVGKQDNQGEWIQPKTWLTSLGFNKLKESYIKYKEGNGGAYFNLVMGELENLFIRGSISVDDIDDNLFRDFFNKNNYGVAKGGVDFDKLNVDFDDSEKSKEKKRYNGKGEKKFIAMLSDFNLDGRLDHNDRGYYMGLELDNIYRSVNVDFQNSELSEQVQEGQYVWKNIVNFAIDYFEAMGDNDIVSELQSVNTIGELNTILKEKKGDEGYKTLKALQTMLKDSPVPISFICKYGNKAQEMFLNELMGDEKFDEMYDKEFDKLVEQGMDPKLKMGLKPAIYASYINGGIGGGLGVAYDTDNIGTISMSLGASHVPGSNDLQYGIVLGWQQKEGFKVGKWNGKIGANVGYTTQGFLALGGIDFVSGVSNKKELKAMNADSVQRITIGARGGWMANGLFASLAGGKNYDYLEGTINKHNELNNYLRGSLAKMFDDEKFKTFFTNGKLDTTKGEEIKGFLREKLGEAGEKNEDVVNSAVENIYSGLMYFSAGLNFDEKDEKAFGIAKNRMIYQLSETYTNKYISEHINENLDNKLKLTNWSVGPAIFFNGNVQESILKSAYYSVLGGLQFTKYGNTYMTETDASKAQYESRLLTGMGLDYLEGSVENGKITQRTINYLNDKLSIIGNYDIEKMGIRFESLEDDGAKNVLYIPKDLFRWGVNMYLDPALKEYVTADDKGFKVPLNTEIALLTRSRTNSTQFDLVIGNYRKDSDAITLSSKYQYEGKPLNYVPQNQGEKVFNIETINNSLSEFSKTKPNFPLSSCEKMDDGKMAFSMKDGCEVGVDKNGVLALDNGKIVVPSSYGKLLVKKISDLNYIASFEAGNEEKLAIEYRDGNDVVGNGESIPLGEVFGKYKELDGIFKDIEKKLSLMDNGNKLAYADFMNAAATENIDDILDDSDYEKAFQNLSDLLRGKLKDPCFDGLRGKLDNPTFEEKVMIVDRFKAIFSYNDGLVNKDNLELQLQGRGDEYKNLYGYDRSASFPLKSDIDYRKTVKDGLNKQGKFERKLNPNLVGMTAFYRLGDKNAGRSYMMTEIGGTYVLGGEMVSITNENDLKETKDWFIKNLKKSGVHKNILESALTEKIKGALKIDSLGDNGLDLEKVLRGNAIDIGGKKIKFNINYVFYLLGECANESIGVEIGDIVIVDSGNNGDNDGDIIEIAPEQTGRSTGVYVGNLEAANRTIIQEVAKIGGGVATGIGGNKPQDAPDGGGTGHINGGGTGPL